MPPLPAKSNLRRGGVFPPVCRAIRSACGRPMVAPTTRLVAIRKPPSDVDAKCQQGWRVACQAKRQGEHAQRRSQILLWIPLTKPWAFLDKTPPHRALCARCGGVGLCFTLPDYFLSSSSNLQENFSPQAGQVRSEGSMSPAKQTFSPQEGHSISKVSSSSA